MELNLTRAALRMAVVAALSTCVAATSPGHAQQMVSVSRDEINIRSGPGMKFEALWSVIRGYPLRVIGRRGGWLRVRDFEGDRGWVFRPLTGRSPHHIVKARDALLRARPSTRSPVVGRLSYGEVLTTLAKRGGWVRVRQSGGASGWVARSLVWGW